MEVKENGKRKAVVSIAAILAPVSLPSAVQVIGWILLAVLLCAWSMRMWRRGALR